MVFDEVSVGEGIFAADENNFRNSSRGAFVRNGGNVTVGASSQDIALNIDACDIRIQTTDWSIASGTVTLADNATAYPRRDLVFAKKGPTASDPGSFEVATGTPIDTETMQTLVSEGVINQDGTPIAKPEDIPEVQPPAFQGHRDDSTLLAMVYVPPGASDSTAVASGYLTDLRMEGIGVTDVLRQGDAIQNIESLNRPLDVTATDSARLGGDPVVQWRSNYFSLSTPAVALSGTTGQENIYFKLGPAQTLELYSYGRTQATNPEQSYGNLLATIGTVNPDGSKNRAGSAANNFARVNVTINGPATAYMGCYNNTGTDLEANAYFNFEVR